jgi:DNA-binding XRE family transcriptional regulator
MLQIYKPLYYDTTIFSTKIENIDVVSTEAKYLKALAKHIDKLRREKGLSFQEMALACDMEKAQVYRLCNEGINITALTARKLAEGLEVTVSDLFDFSY